ncbi:TPA: hypothetical protein ACGO8I_000189 [Streptococcus suis]|nr:hypothetical protein [Streptococcus suis]
MKDRKLLSAVLVTAVISMVVSFVIFNVLSSNGVTFNNTLSNGTYVNNETDFPIKLEIDGDTALLTLSGLSQTAEIDRDAKEFRADDSSYSYKMVAGKLVLDLNGREVAFKKTTEEIEQSNTKESSSKSSSTTTSDESVAVEDMIEDAINDNVGMTIGLLNTAIEDILYGDSIGDGYIYNEVVDEAGDYLGTLSSDDLKNYKVVKLLSLEKDDDGDYNLTVVAKK